MMKRKVKTMTRLEIKERKEKRIVKKKKNAQTNEKKSNVKQNVRK